MLKGKRILLGISGGIAAYKVPLLLRMFIRQGAQVRIVVSQNALEFVTLTTLETLSGFPVYVDMFPHGIQRSTEHIEITDWADFMVLAPATANVVGKLAAGIADDALSTTLLAFEGPLFLAPAMNSKMWNHPAVSANIQTLKARGVNIIDPDEGSLACGYDGIGRMKEPDFLLDYIVSSLSVSSELQGVNVLVTAGPTHESIDPVRFIGNHSSGKMGFALAEAFARHGAEVTLVSGPVSLTTHNHRIRRVDVITAEQMNQACLEVFPNCQLTVMAAAVADFKPKLVAKDKIKKANNTSGVIELTKTTDILAGLGKMKTKNQILVGFALETNNELLHAKEKLNTKNLDMIVLNSLKDEGSGFGTDTNMVTLIFPSLKSVKCPLQSKKDVAEQIVSTVYSLYRKIKK